MQSSSGKRINLTKICNTSGKGGIPMKKKANEKVFTSGWDVKLGGSEPQKMPNGDIVYPNGTIRFADGTVLKPEFNDGVPTGFKHYDANGKLLD
jgi:hypothetical protein